MAIADAGCVAMSPPLTQLCIACAFRFAYASAMKQFMMLVLTVLTVLALASTASTAVNSRLPVSLDAPSHVRSCAETATVSLVTKVCAKKNIGKTVPCHQNLAVIGPAPFAVVASNSPRTGTLLDRGVAPGRIAGLFRPPRS